MEPKVADVLIEGEPGIETEPSDRRRSRPSFAAAPTLRRAARTARWSWGIAGLTVIVFGCGGTDESSPVDSVDRGETATTRDTDVGTATTQQTTIPTTIPPTIPTTIPPTIPTTTPPSTGPTRAVLIIDGVEYTCDEVIGGQCGSATEDVFAQYKDNLDRFLNSGALGPLNNSSYEDAAFAGLAACTFAADGETEFIDFMLTDPAFADADRVYFLPSWFEAQESLCPDLEFASDVP